MKKKYLLALLFVGQLFFTGFAQDNQVYHISKAGNDSNSGTSSSPFKTLKKASEVLKPGDSCIVHAGIYRECFTPKNNGTAEKPIVMIAAEGENVIISGMEAMKGWQKSGKGIYKAQTSTDMGESNFVLIDGKMAFEARFPNKTNNDLLDIEAGTVIEEHVSARGAGEVHPSPVRFVIETALPELCSSENLSDAKVWVLAHRKWSSWIAPVTAYDSKEQLIWFKEFEGSRISNNANPNWLQEEYGRGLYYIFGSKVLLDAPNEWYFDKNTKELYVMVSGNKKPADGQVEFRNREVVVDLSDKKFWEVSGFKIEGATIDMRNAQHCTINRCKVFYLWHHFPTYAHRSLTAKYSGIVISGKHNVIKNSEIAYSAAAGLTLSGENNTVANNLMHHTNYIGSISTGGMMVTGLNHKIIYNTLHSSGRDIVKYQGGASVLAWNHLYNPGMICYDLGAVYSAGTDYRNTLIHHNIVHNDNYDHHPCNGIYFDNFTNNVVVHHNIVWGNLKTGIRSNRPGNYHQIFNNISLSIDNRWSPWQGPGTQFGSSIVNNYIIDPLLANEEVFAANNINDFPLDTLKFLPLKTKLIKGLGKYEFPDYLGAFSSDTDNWTEQVGHDFKRNSTPSASKEMPFMMNYIKNGSFDWGRDRRGNLIEVTQGKFWDKTGKVELSYSPGFNFPAPNTRNSVYANSLLLKSNDAGISQTVKGLKPDFPYKIGVYVRSDENAEVILSIRSNTIQKEASSAEVLTIAGWKLLVLPFQIGLKDSEIVVSIRKEGEGDVYVDNIGLVPDLKMAEKED